jgi:hypothetical protein
MYFIGGKNRFNIPRDFLVSTHLQSILPKHPKLLPLATRREYETVII